MTEDANRRRRWNPLTWAVVLLAAVVLAIVLLLLQGLLRPTEPPPDGPTPAPVIPGTASPLASAAASPPASASPSAPSVPRSGAVAVVGDYGCRTLADASAAIEVDGFVFGSVAYTLEGGPVADDWLVSNQTPAAGERALAGTTVDLILSSPFLVCPSP